MILPAKGVGSLESEILTPLAETVTGGLLGGAAAALKEGLRDAAERGMEASRERMGLHKGLKIDNLTSRTISSITTTIENMIRNKITGSETLCMHFTNESAAKLIERDGIRSSADGQGGGGFYVVKAEAVGKVLRSKSKKLDRECFLRCLVSLYGVVNAKEKFERSPNDAIESLNVMMLIKIPNMFLSRVILDEGDERRGMCELHYVSKERYPSHGPSSTRENGLPATPPKRAEPLKSNRRMIALEISCTDVENRDSPLHATACNGPTRCNGPTACDDPTRQRLPVAWTPAGPPTRWVVNKGGVGFWIREALDSG